ncbi:septal ring lytic transglycosylase RlpA family protein [Algibacillus agarilyticus]|uniref:septal ring lytic transglycosylase RlpA family protein n=1 Tax=Algibacillus agarilyticus TaxID=2234133 RepID=UPI0022B81B8F|nr:septal ring lytic transglycosylase RlpA family protein [Algibacillus agarilyticus]
MMNKGLIVLCCVLLGACTANTSRYALTNDLAPTRIPTTKEMQNPIAYYTEKSRGGNKPYEVNGQAYDVIQDAKGFEETGIASWYGRKFHGHLTSNGEIYDMFTMTAAHKNLPLPIYVEVTNLDNNKTAIVRVNDRGPFHPERIIDLSYSAAYKLGMTDTGTANVKIKALATTPGGYLFIERSQDKAALQGSASVLALLYNVDSKIVESEGAFELIMGPIAEEEKLLELQAYLTLSGYSPKRL